MSLHMEVSNMRMYSIKFRIKRMLKSKDLATKVEGYKLAAQYAGLRMELELH